MLNGSFDNGTPANWSRATKAEYGVWSYVNDSFLWLILAANLCMAYNADGLDPQTSKFAVSKKLLNLQTFANLYNFKNF